MATNHYTHTVWYNAVVTMGGFNPAWFVSIGFGAVLVAADFLVLSKDGRRTVGSLSLILGFILILVGICGLLTPILRPTSAPLTQIAEKEPTDPIQTKDEPTTERHSKNKGVEKKAGKSIDDPTTAPYDLTESRQKELISFLNGQDQIRDTIRICCTAGSESGCVAAGKFLLALSEAGWKIDQGQVFQMQAQIPRDGISFIIRPNAEASHLPQLPPHQGRWALMSSSMISLLFAFRRLGITTTPGGNADMPEDTIGICFGPEPKKLMPMTEEETTHVSSPQKPLTQFQAWRLNTLSAFVLGGVDLRNKFKESACHGNPQDTSQVVNQVNEWHSRLEKFLAHPRLEPRYLLSLGNQVPPPSSYPCAMKEFEAWNMLSSDLVRLDEFTKEH